MCAGICIDLRLLRAEATAEAERQVDDAYEEDKHADDSADREVGVVPVNIQPM